MTSQSVETRWTQHKRRARNNTAHPFYNAIRKYGEDNFIVDVLATTYDVEEAKQLEIKHIELENSAYNISKGGDYDTVAANQSLWKHMYDDPDVFEDYKKKLSDIGKERAKNHPELIEKLADSWRAWEQENHKVAYKHAARALRIARAKTNKRVKPIEDKPMTKDELMKKHKPSKNRSIKISEAWARMDEETKEKRRETMSEATTKYMASLTTEQRQAVTSKARQCFAEYGDLAGRNKKIGKGVHAFWESLRQDPVAYEEYKKKKREKLRETRRLKNENV